jgi:hypothetical protein
LEYLIDKQDWVRESILQSARYTPHDCFCVVKGFKKVVRAFQNVDAQQATNLKSAELQILALDAVLRGSERELQAVMSWWVQVHGI